MLPPWGTDAFGPSPEPTTTRLHPDATGFLTRGPAGRIMAGNGGSLAIAVREGRNHAEQASVVPVCPRRVRAGVGGRHPRRAGGRRPVRSVGCADRGATDRSE